MASKSLFSLDYYVYQAAGASNSASLTAFVDAPALHGSQKCLKSTLANWSSSALIYFVVRNFFASEVWSWLDSLRMISRVLEF